jgi:hypothetical protein
MKPYQSRVLEEKVALDDKIEKITSFLTLTDSDPAYRVPDAERSRLQRQLEAMSEYSAILAERIAAF